LKTMCTYCL